MYELEGLEYLRGFPDFELGSSGAETTLGLERVSALLEELGSPHLRLPIIHVAGTKGKGSTAVSIAAILRAAGYRTGLFTSPHLTSVFERFQLDGVEIAASVLSALVMESIRPAVARLKARGIHGVQQFEAQAAIAMQWFVECRVDCVVLEVGLGGRLDATNVVPEPLACTLTPIGLDHTAILGETLSQIAAEKAAIIKRNSIAVAAPQPQSAATVFVAAASRLDVPLWLGNRDWHAGAVISDLTGTGFDLDLSDALRAFINRRLDRVPSLLCRELAADDALARFHTPLLGAHQAINAACAIVTVLTVARAFPSITLAAVRQGLSNVVWPGRLQIIGYGPAVIVDGAHTPESALVLADAIRHLFPARRVILVCGIQVDKDIRRIAATLADLAHLVIATHAGHLRAASTAVVASAFRHVGHPDVEEHDAPAAALAAARHAAGPNDLVLVTGSLYLVGDILRLTKHGNATNQCGETVRGA